MMRLLIIFILCLLSGCTTQDKVNFYIQQEKYMHAYELLEDSDQNETNEILQKIISQPTSSKGALSSTSYQYEFFENGNVERKISSSKDRKVTEEYYEDGMIKKREDENITEYYDQPDTLFLACLDSEPIIHGKHTLNVGIGRFFLSTFHTNVKSEKYTSYLGDESYQYDEHGILTECSVSGGCSITKKNEGDILVVEMANAHGTTIMKYRNNLLIFSDEHGLLEQTFSYDESDRIHSIQIHDKTINIAYDENDRVTALTNGDAYMRISYRPDGQIEKIEYPDGISSHYEYDEAGNLCKLNLLDHDKIIVEYTYTYDTYGRILYDGMSDYTYSYDWK